MAYQATVWSTGDTITASLANNWETGIESVHNTTDAHVAAAAPHSGHVDIDGSKTMTGPLKFTNFQIEYNATQNSLDIVYTGA